MKVWSSIFNIFGILILLIMMLSWRTQDKTARVDYDTERLRIATDFCAEAAFIKVKDNGSSIDNDYTGLVRNVIISPDNSLDTFEEMMCYCYGMEPNEDNKARVESYIPSAILACTDGYYITKLVEDWKVGEYEADGTFREFTKEEPYNAGRSTYYDCNGALVYKGSYPSSYKILNGVTYDGKGNVLDKDTGKIKVFNGKRFKWSMKLPYIYYQRDNTEITNPDALTDTQPVDMYAVTLDGRNCVKLTRVRNGNTFEYRDLKYEFPITNKDTITKAVNARLTDALAKNVQEVGQERGGVDYNVYLPVGQTKTGINQINGQSLIILLQGADFTGDANVTEATISGLKIVRKRPVVGFKISRYNSLTGTWSSYTKEYAFGDQMPTSTGSKIKIQDKILFKSTGEAAKAGYNPCLNYIMDDSKFVGSETK